MRCKACDKNLSDFEATRKVKTSGEYVDLCNKCFFPIADNIEVLERFDLANQNEFEDNECDVSDTNHVLDVENLAVIDTETI